jgi:hypothetical protein
MLHFQGWTAFFDSPLTVEVVIADTESGQTEMLSRTAKAPQMNQTYWSTHFRTEIYAVIQAKGWKQTKIRINEVRLNHPQAKGDPEELAFCQIIFNFLKQTYAAL